LLAGELSPTIVRNMFLGFTGFAGETGSLLAPYTNALVSFFLYYNFRI
jgi:hypothetical protein